MSDNKQLQRWGDAQMYAAQPMKSKRPVAHLLWMTPDPLGAIAAACRMFEGKPTYTLEVITDEEREHYWKQATSTHLKAPLEFVKFHFFIEGVTRAFTHQMVRQRTAVYAQESLRFAVKENFASEAAVPPSVAGLADGDPARETWDRAITQIEEAYNDLIARGVPAEDARGLLPHATTTRLHYATDLRALTDHAGNRLCTQAQFEWRYVFASIVDQIRFYGHARDDEAARRAGYLEDPRRQKEIDESNWQFAHIADSMMFRPVCYALNRCPFNAVFDRACSIKERVESYARSGISSDQWDTGFNNGEKIIDPIRSEEWMLDSTAARIR